MGMVNLFNNINILEKRIDVCRIFFNLADYSDYADFNQGEKNKSLE